VVRCGWDETKHECAKSCGSLSDSSVAPLSDPYAGPFCGPSCIFVEFGLRVWSTARGFLSNSQPTFKVPYFFRYFHLFAYIRNFFAQMRKSLRTGSFDPIRGEELGGNLANTFSALVSKKSARQMNADIVALELPAFGVKFNPKWRSKQRNTKTGIFHPRKTTSSLNYVPSLSNKKTRCIAKIFAFS